MLGKVDLDVGYDLQGVYKKGIVNHHFYMIKLYVNAKLFCTSGGIPLASDALVAMLKNRAIQYL